MLCAFTKGSCRSGVRANVIALALSTHYAEPLPKHTFESMSDAYINYKSSIECDAGAAHLLHTLRCWLIKPIRLRDNVGLGFGRKIRTDTE